MTFLAKKLINNGMRIEGWVKMVKRRSDWPMVRKLLKVGNAAAIMTWDSVYGAGSVKEQSIWGYKRELIRRDFALGVNCVEMNSAMSFFLADWSLLVLILAGPVVVVVVIGVVDWDFPRRNEAS